MSGKSGSSIKTTTSSRAEAAAKVAGLKAKLEFLDLEAKTKADLEKVQTMMQLKVAEAEHQAYMEAERCDDRQSDILLPETDKTEYVEKFVKSTLNPQVTDSYTPDNAGATPFQFSEANPAVQQFSSTPAWARLEQSQMIADISKNFADQIKITRLPMPEPDVFSGEPLKYPAWSRAFETLIEHQTIPSSERIHYLQRYLGGEARSVVEGCFLLEGEDAYQEARRLLKHRYGDPFLVASSFRDKLDSWPQIGTRDATGLQKLSDFLQQIKVAIRTNDGLSILNDSRENRKILAKLPDWVVTRWARVVSDWKRHFNTYPPFEDFARFIEKEADIACDPVTSLQSLRRDSTRKPRGSSSFVTETEEPAVIKGDQAKQTVRCILHGHQGHHLDNCRTFLAKPMDERKEFIKEKGLCYGCLSPGHRAKICEHRLKCKTCGKNHATALHGDVKKTPKGSHEQTQDQQQVQSTSARISVDQSTSSKSSMIVPVWLSHSSKPKTERLVYALLDTQSDTTFVLDSSCDALGVTGPDVKLSLSTMFAANRVVDSRKISGLSVRGYNSELKIPLPPAYTRHIMPANRSHIPTPDMANQWPHLEKIAPKLMPLRDCEVGLLIGYNCPIALTPREVIPPVQNGPFAQRTDLGWGIVGIVNPVSIEGDNIGVSHRVVACEVPQSLRSPDKPSGLIAVALETRIKEVINPFEKMAELDFTEPKSESHVSQDDLKFLQQVKEGIHLTTDGHYEMPLPFRVRPKLANNRAQAVSRLGQLRKRFQREPEYEQDYKQFMSKVIDSGYAEKVPESELQLTDDVWYIPHHGVYHPRKRDKIRVVFDCSAQYNGQSLNESLLQGPDLTNNLVGVLFRFRKHPVAFTCDVEQMFCQFRVNEEDRNFLRFLWWDNADTECEPSEYRMTVHLFGATSSPGCANFALKQMANDHESECGKDVADFIRQDFYVDDGLTSVETATDAIDLISQSKKLCAKAGLRLHKFVSNCKDVIAAIPPEDREKGMQNLDPRCDTLPVERALGVQWCIQSDTLQFQITLKDQPLTRRGILSTVSSLYDPLGLVAPVTLVGKQILQEMCRDQADWDASLPDNLRSRWEQWRHDLFLLETLRVPRCYRPTGFGTVASVELHHFSDASMSGYAQCSYLRLMDADGQVHCSLVMGKARVAPLKVVTIPRLELTAAVVSVKISALLQEELQYENITEVFWTDSKVVLGYIANDSRRFHVFVANRIQQIKNHTDTAQWRHVQTKENPADEGSRGLHAADMKNSKWLNGPDFLWEREIPPDEYTEHSIIPGDPEVKKAQTFETQAEESSSGYLLERLGHFSDWYRAKRAVAVCLRLKQKLKLRRLEKTEAKTEPPVTQKKTQEYQPVTVDELHQAELTIIKLVQQQAFQEEMHHLSSTVKNSDAESKPLQTHTAKSTSSLHRLDPYVDADGILRVGGRMSRAEFSSAIRHPVILPRKHHITVLVIRHYHEKTEHQGRGMTTNEIRSNGYWILGCSSAVYSYVSKCVTCRKMRGNLSSQKMADLPEDRLEPAPCFSYCAADFFGPILIKEGRKELKRYGALFTCMASRAIHIEIANSLETDSFINALRRFIAIRGPIRQLRTDRGTNFVGAEKELQRAVEEMKDDQISEFLRKENCDYVQFRMNVPSASHMGGVWERQIRSVRNVLAHVLKEAGTQLDDELLRTLMSEVTAVVNSRPLTTDNLNDPESLEPLTPNHVLTMKSKLLLPPPGEFQRADLYCRKKWRRIQYLTDQFWNRWKREYLQTLQIRQKWNTPRRNMKVGDIVILKDENTVRNQWKLARVVEAIESKDGYVRKLKLAMGSHSLDSKGKRITAVSYLERPIQKVVLLVENE